MITSVRNPHIQGARKLQRRGVREQRRQFLVEGANGITQALLARPDGSCPLTVLFVEEDGGFPELTSRARGQGIRVLSVSEAVMRSISGTTTPPGIVGVSRYVDRDPVALLRGPLDLVVVLSGVRDPGNAGTIIRSCAASGADAVFFAGSTVDVYNPKVIRASAGTVFNLAIARGVEIRWLLGELGRLKVNRVTADPLGDSVYDRVDFRRRTAVVLGNEAWGVESDLVSAMDARVSIPMSKSVESLNVGMAATVLLFEAARQRRAG